MSASAAGCVWRHEAKNLNEVSAVAQRVPRPSVRQAGLASLDMPAAMPCAPSRICRAPVKPARASQADWSPSAAALAVCSCLESAASRRNSHRPAACVPAVPSAWLMPSASRPNSLATAAAAASVPTVPVVWKTR
ncbi:hypothetical protein D3C72_1460250 [compost metagenome]